MTDDHLQTEEEPVCGAWQRLVQAVLILFLAIAALVTTRCLLPVDASSLEPQVRALTQQVEKLEQEQAMPSLVLNRYRDSICYIFGIYEIGFPHHRALTRTRISG